MSECESKANCLNLSKLESTILNKTYNQNRSSRTPRPGFSLFECYIQKIGAIFSKHNSVLVFLVGQNPKCPGYNLRKEPRRQVQIYLQRVFLPPPSPVLANIHSILAYDVPRTKDVGLPTKFRFNVGPASQPIAASKPVSRLDAGPALIHHRVCCILCVNTWHSPNAV